MSERGAGGRGTAASEGERERPHDSAQWAYIGPWVEFDVGVYGRFRYRKCAHDDGSWSSVSVQQERRNGWCATGKEFGRGIHVGQALAALGVDAAFHAPALTSDSESPEHAADPRTQPSPYAPRGSSRP